MSLHFWEMKGVVLPELSPSLSIFVALTKYGVSNQQIAEFIPNFNMYSQLNIQN